MKEKEYYCKICDASITKWQHDYNDDICIFCQDELDNEDVEDNEL